MKLGSGNSFDNLNTTKEKYVVSRIICFMQLLNEYGRFSNYIQQLPNWNNSADLAWHLDLWSLSEIRSLSLDVYSEISCLHLTGVSTRISNQGLILQRKACLRRLGAGDIWLPKLKHRLCALEGSKDAPRPICTHCVSNVAQKRLQRLKPVKRVLRPAKYSGRVGLGFALHSLLSAGNMEGKRLSERWKAAALMRRVPRSATFCSRRSTSAGRSTDRRKACEGSDRP